MSGVLSLDFPVATDPAGAVINGRERMRALVRVHPNHDHVDRPFVLVDADEADLGGQTSVGALPRSLSVQGS
jgi:hypothetical protein